MTTPAKSRAELIALVQEFSFAVVDATKGEGAIASRNRREEKAAKKLLAAILDSEPTEHEVRQVIYC